MRRSWVTWCWVATLLGVCPGMTRTAFADDEPRDRATAADKTGDEQKTVLEPFALFDTLVGNSTYSATWLRWEQPLSTHWSFQGQLKFSFLTFRTEQDHKTVHAEAPAVTPLIGLGYRFTPSTTLTILGGGQIKETRFFGGRPSRRNDDGAATEIHFDSTLPASIDLSTIYIYTAGDNTSWGQISATREVVAFGADHSGALALGIAVSSLRGRDFDEERGGLVVDLTHTPTDANMTLGVGLGHLSTGRTRDNIAPYVSVDVHLRF